LNNPYILNACPYHFQNFQKILEKLNAPKLSWLQVKQKLLHLKMIAMLASEEPANGIISASVK